MIIIVSVLEMVGSQRRRHSQPATDRPVQGTTPSRRRVTPDRPIGGGKGGRRLCGRVPGNAVFLKQDRCKSTREQRRPNQDHQTPENSTRTATPPRKPEPKKQPSASDGEEKKKQVRERNLGVGEGEEVRVVVVVCVQEEENTRGNPNQKGLGSPAPERERERERERENTASTKPTIQKKKRGTHTKAKYGSGLEGLKNQTNYQPQRQKRETINQRTKTKTITEKRTDEPSTSLGICLLQGGGAHGPPCLRPRGAEVST